MNFKNNNKSGELTLLIQERERDDDDGRYCVSTFNILIHEKCLSANNNNNMHFLHDSIITTSNSHTSPY